MLREDGLSFLNSGGEGPDVPVMLKAPESPPS
jgi:hypothetical protein